jgi:hypothetical protein
MVVKRKTRSEDMPCLNHIVPRVQPLLSVPRRVHADPLRCEARATTLNADCSWTAPSTTTCITELVIDPSAAARVTAKSQQLLPTSQVAALRPNPAEGEWLASHSCEAGLWQGHPHIARYHTTTSQQLPTPQRESLHTTPLNPFPTPERGGDTA